MGVGQLGGSGTSWVRVGPAGWEWDQLGGSGATVSCGDSAVPGDPTAGARGTAALSGSGAVPQPKPLSCGGGGERQHGRGQVLSPLAQLSPPWLWGDAGGALGCWSCCSKVGPSWGCCGQGAKDRGPWSLLPLGPHRPPVHTLSVSPVPRPQQPLPPDCMEALRAGGGTCPLPEPCGSSTSGCGAGTPTKALFGQEGAERKGLGVKSRGEEQDLGQEGLERGRAWGEGGCGLEKGHSEEKGRGEVKCHWEGTSVRKGLGRGQALERGEGSRGRLCDGPKSCAVLSPAALCLHVVVCPPDHGTCAAAGSTLPALLWTHGALWHQHSLRCRTNTLAPPASEQGGLCLSAWPCPAALIPPAPCLL